VPPGAIERGFAQAHVPGRFDRRGKWIFDVAHNPNGTEALVAALGQTQPPRPIHALVAVLKDKDWRTMLRSLSAVVDQVWLTDAPSAPPDRRWDLQAVSRELGPPFKVEADFTRALDQVQRGASTVLVTGSFHTVGDAMARIPGFAPLGDEGTDRG
jgi:dihydrofolate synthase/folylpolyglutamate synthase